MPNQVALTRRYPVSAPVLHRALAIAAAGCRSVTLRTVDAGRLTAVMASTFAPARWDTDLQATVTPHGGDESVLTITGTLRQGCAPQTWREDVHHRRVESELFAAIDTALARAADEVGTSPPSPGPVVAARAARHRIA